MQEKRANRVGSGQLLFAGVVALFLFAAISLPVLGCQREVISKSALTQVKTSYAASPLVDRKLLGLFTHSVQSSLNGIVPPSERGWVRNPRIYVHWTDIEPSRNVFSFSKVDREVKAALAMGVDSVFMTLGGGVPKWAQNPGAAGDPGKAPPLNIDDWKNFCKRVALHYKGYVSYYQIWQEPGWDLGAPPAKEGVVYFTGDAQYDYIPLLRAGYNGIKSADPNAYVMTGSLLDGLTRQPSDYANYEVLLGGGNQDVSMKVQAGSDIVAERPMYFNYHGTINDGTTELGVKNPSTTWYMAEGATHPGFDEWLCIQNPGAVTAKVGITYMFPGGQTQQQNLDVAANSRSTVSVNDAVGPNRDVSARVSSDKPIVVDRPMYFLYHGKWDGGSISSGVSSLSKTWYFAEGATQPGIEEWMSLMNPGAVPANVKITYMFPGGATHVQRVTVSPTSRQTVLVNDVIGPNMDVSAEVESDQPIVAERPMYFLYHGAWSGGDTQVGAMAPSTSWLLAEGTTRNNQYDGAFEEWISMQNPGATTAHVNLKYMFPGGATQGMRKDIAPHSRATVLVNDVVGPNKDVSVQLDSDQPIVVERPMYFNYHNSISGGDVALGCTQANQTWYFAEGTTRQGFQEWLTLQNPGSSQTTATITFMFGDKTTATKQVTLPANSRTTVGINDSVSMAAYCDGVAVNPYHYPDVWVEYYNNIRDICRRHGYDNTEVVISEIGWPHESSSNPGAFTPEGQRWAIGEGGVAPLFNAGCRKIWLYEDVDDPPSTSWDHIYDGLFYYNGSPTPAWGEYKKWQQQLPDYPNKPSTMVAPIGQGAGKTTQPTPK